MWLCRAQETLGTYAQFICSGVGVTGICIWDIGIVIYDYNLMIFLGLELLGSRKEVRL